MPVYESQVPLRGPSERIFDFLTRPANMKLISPPEVQMSIVEAPEVLSLGSKIVFKVVVYGHVQQFEHEIIDFESPTRFREKAIVTPMKSWQQEYSLQPSDNDEVILCTRIEFEPPGGMLGFILTEDRILETLKDNHQYRREALQKALA